MHTATQTACQLKLRLAALHGLTTPAVHAACQLRLTALPQQPPPAPACSARHAAITPVRLRALTERRAGPHSQDGRPRGCAPPAVLHRQRPLLPLRQAAAGCWSRPRPWLRRAAITGPLAAAERVSRPALGAQPAARCCRIPTHTLQSWNFRVLCALPCAMHYETHALTAHLISGTLCSSSTPLPALPADTRSNCSSVARSPAAGSSTEGQQSGACDWCVHSTRDRSAQRSHKQGCNLEWQLAPAMHAQQVSPAQIQRTFVPPRRCRCCQAG